MGWTTAVKQITSTWAWFPTTRRQNAPDPPKLTDQVHVWQQAAHHLGGQWPQTALWPEGDIHETEKEGLRKPTEVKRKWGSRPEVWSNSTEVRVYICYTWKFLRGVTTLCKIFTFLSMTRLEWFICLFNLFIVKTTIDSTKSCKVVQRSPFYLYLSTSFLQQ